MLVIEPNTLHSHSNTIAERENVGLFICLVDLFIKGLVMNCSFFSCASVVSHSNDTDDNIPAAVALRKLNLC